MTYVNSFSFFFFFSFFHRTWMQQYSWCLFPETIWAVFKKVWNFSQLQKNLAANILLLTPCKCYKMTRNQYEIAELHFNVICYDAFICSGGSKDKRLTKNTCLWKPATFSLMVKSREKEIGRATEKCDSECPTHWP